MRKFSDIKKIDLIYMLKSCLSFSIKDLHFISTNYIREKDFHFQDLHFIKKDLGYFRFKDLHLYITEIYILP